MIQMECCYHEHILYPDPGYRRSTRLAGEGSPLHFSGHTLSPLVSTVPSLEAGLPHVYLSSPSHPFLQPGWLHTRSLGGCHTWKQVS